MRRAEQVLTGGGAVNRAKFDEVSWSRSVNTVSIARSRDRSGSKITSTPASRRVGQNHQAGQTTRQARAAGGGESSSRNPQWAVSRTR